MTPTWHVVPPPWSVAPWALGLGLVKLSPPSSL